MKCPNCNETSRIREKDNFCHRCGCNLKTGKADDAVEQKWKGAILSIDEEVQGNREEISDLNELKDKVNELLDEQVLEVRIKKRAPQRSSSQTTTNTIGKERKEMHQEKKIDIIFKEISEACSISSYMEEDVRKGIAAALKKIEKEEKARRLIKIQFSSEGLEDAEQKVKQLIELLREANNLAASLEEC